MPEINFNKLKDSALDVDPDVRFMVLEDFKKYVSDPNNSVSIKSVESFIPVLIRLLKDQNSDVQSQAIKSFEPIIKLLPNETILDLIYKLFQLVVEANLHQGQFKSFTISIPNMALRSIFQSQFKFSNQLARSIIDKLLPKIITNMMTIDLIEILLDLVKNLGHVLTSDEILSLSVYLINISFNEFGIISKRSIVCLDYLLSYLTNDDTSGNILDKLNIEIDNKFSSTNKSSNFISTKLSLYSTILHSLKAIDQSNDISILGTKSINQILNDLVINLKINELLNRENLDTDDLDFDKLVQENLIREDALNTLNDLINSIPFKSIEYAIDDIIKFIKIFIIYDPLNFENNYNEEEEEEEEESEFSDQESDIEFSDDDENANDDDENDGSWKLRIKSNILTKSLGTRFPLLLSYIYSSLIDLVIQSIDDRNDLVSNEGIKTLITIIKLTSIDNPHSYYSIKSNQRRNSDISMNTDTDPLNLLINKVSPILENKIFNKLLINKKVNRYPIFLKLIESLIVTVNIELSDNFLSNLFNRVIELNLKTNGSMEYLNLYKTILLNFEINQIPYGFISYITNDLSVSISDKTSFYNIIIESINISILLFKKFNKVEDLSRFENNINELFQAIIEKLNNKQYSSDLLQQSILGLSELISNIEIGSADNFKKTIEVVKECLNYEATVKITLENLIKIFEVSNNKQLFFESKNFIDFLVSKLNQFISSTDDSLYYLSLKLLDIISENYEMNNSTEVSDNLIKFLIKDEPSIDFKQLYLSFNILQNNLTNDLINEDTLVLTIKEIINIKLTDIDDFDLTSFELLIKKICKRNETRRLDIFKIFLNNLNLNLFVSAKILSIITIESNLVNEIKKREIELIYSLNNKNKESVNLLFDIQYLGDIGSKFKLEKINFETLLKFLENKDESIKLASARSIGLFVLNDLNIYLPILLDYYEKNIQFRNYLLVSIKQILNFGDKEIHQLHLIWNKVWVVIYNYKDINNIQELRLSGDILSKIVLINDDSVNELINKIDKSERLPISIIYTIIVILKQLINNSLSSNDKLLLNLIIKALKFFDILNIEVKQVLIGTLLTGLHNKSEILLPVLNDKILPLIFNELKARSEFKKIIPMGPYKYVIDEGLEIRKLSYELLYTIISLDKKTIDEHQMEIDKIGENIIANGLKDEETDIIILSTINLISLISNDKADFLMKNINVLTLLINNLKFNLNKKLKSKASAQETENFEESLKSITRLSKHINNYFTTKNYLNNEWNNYYIDMKTNFNSYYNSIE